MAKVKSDKISSSDLLEKTGNMSLIAIFLLSGIAAFIHPDMSVMGISVVTGLLAICGALVAITNIRKNEETPFLIAVIGLTVVSTSLFLIQMPSQLQVLLANVMVSFGISGFIVALGMIIRLGWGR